MQTDLFKWIRKVLCKVWYYENVFWVKKSLTSMHMKTLLELESFMRDIEEYVSNYWGINDLNM